MFADNVLDDRMDKLVSMRQTFLSHFYQCSVHSGFPVALPSLTVDIAYSFNLSFQVKYDTFNADINDVQGELLLKLRVTSKPRAMAMVGTDKINIRLANVSKRNWT